MMSVFVAIFLTLFYTQSNGATVKFYLNECVDDLVLDNYHNYTGKITIPPPTNIKENSSALLFEYEYASKAEFGSLLDGNINYYKSKAFITDKNNNQILNVYASDILLHVFVNINATGGIYVSVQTNKNEELSGSACSDVPNNGGTLPKVVGVYAWFTTNQTETECKAQTPPITDCKYTFDFVNK